MSSEEATAVAATTNGSTSPYGPNVHISCHPIISHKITLLRSSQTNAGTFRAAMREVTFHLGYEATKDLKTTPIQVSVAIPKSGPPTEHFQCTGQKLVEHVAIIPILRSGLGMADSMEQLLPKASSYHIGMYKIKDQDPVLYFNRLPRKCVSDIAYVLDPIIATASTVVSVVKILKKWGVPKIHIISIIGSKTGIQQLLEKFPDIHITIGTIDDTVNDDGVVVPGFGDAGDRLFGTSDIPDYLEDEEALLHPSKRKRSASQGE